MSRADKMTLRLNVVFSHIRNFWW